MLRAVIILLIVFFTPFSFGKIMKFDNVSEMFTDRNDYPEYGGKPTFKILTETPLSIQLSTIVTNGDLNPLLLDQLTQQIQRTAVYAVYRIYTHTNYNGNLTVTILPLNIDTSQYLYDMKFTFSITKSKAQNLMSKFSGITDFEDIIQDDGFETWDDKFNDCCYYSDKLDVFFHALTSE